MTTTIHQLAEEIAVRLATLGVNAIRAYDTPVEAAEAPSRGAGAQVRFLGRERMSGCNQKAKFEVLVSVPADDKGWPDAVEALRGFLDVTGDTSIEAAIEADRTLGGVASDCVVTGTDRERLVAYQDSKRWAAPVFVIAFYEGY